jgi:hypothetical protein
MLTCYATQQRRQAFFVFRSPFGTQMELLVGPTNRNVLGRFGVVAQMTPV